MRGKKHIPNDMTRDKVRELTGQGSSQPMMAAALGIEEKCLRRHYRDESDVGIGQANASVASNLFRIATGEGTSTVTGALLVDNTRWLV